MAAEGVAVAELTPERVERFVGSRRAAGYRHFLVAERAVAAAGVFARAGGDSGAGTCRRWARPLTCSSSAIANI